MAAASWVMSDPKRFAAAERACRGGPAARPPRARADPVAATAAVGLDGVPRRTGTTEGDVPRVVGPHPRPLGGS